MHWPQLLLTDRQGAHQQRLGLLILALRVVESGQVVKAGGRERVEFGFQQRRKPIIRYALMVGDRKCLSNTRRFLRLFIIYVSIRSVQSH